MNITNPTTPTGFGVYIRSLASSPRSDPDQLAAWLSAHGVTWAAIGTIWHDVEPRRLPGGTLNPKAGRPRERWINPPATVIRLANALSRHEIKPHLWGFPWWDRIQEFLEALERCLCGSVVGMLPDPEVGVKGHPGAARALFYGLRRLAPELLLGVTSYGFPSGHPTFPWEEFAVPGTTGDDRLDVDYFSGQFYGESNPGMIASACRLAEQLGFDALCPSVGAFHRRRVDGRMTYPRMTAPAFRRHLEAFLTGTRRFRALICWSENLISLPCWEVVQELAPQLLAASC